MDNKKTETKSIFRYPGGKTRKANEISEYFNNFDTIISPFLGGGSVELKLANNGKNVISADLDKHLINCWENLCHNRDEMYEYANEYAIMFHSNIPKENKRELYYALKDYASFIFDVKGAAAYWIVNRLSFSGLGLKGGFSEQAIKAELGPLIMKRLKEWVRLQGFMVPVCMSFEELLSKFNHTVPIFLDPPYFLTKGWLYPNHENFDHYKLYDCLMNIKNPFMMTYNNCEEIMELYTQDKEIKIEEKSWYYAMTNKRQGNELFISRGII